jgi:hypothetical protein
VNVAPQSTFEAVIDTGTTGLTGVIGVGANDNQGGQAIAFSTAGVLEIAPGVYSVSLTAPATAGQYTLIWRQGAGGEVLGIEDLLVTYTAAAPAPGPPVTVYATLAELQRVLQKPSPTLDEQAAMQRDLDAAALEINLDLSYTPDTNPPPDPGTPQFGLLAAVNLDRAVELWAAHQRPFGAQNAGPDMMPLVSPRDTWYRHHLRLNPLRTLYPIG